MDPFPCLALQDTYENADSHWNKTRQGYHTATAAAHAEEVAPVIREEATIEQCRFPLLIKSVNYTNDPDS